MRIDRTDYTMWTLWMISVHNQLFLAYDNPFPNR